jgi:hypothetical protein
VLAGVALALQAAPSGAWKAAAFTLGLLAMILSLPIVERMQTGVSSRLIAASNS